MSIKHHLALATPIVQAPMAGASSADFVIAGCRAGALGSLGAGMMSPVAIDDAIRAIKRGTDKPFNVNLMILDDKDSQAYSEPMPDWLVSLYDELGVEPVLDGVPAWRFDEQFACLLANPVPVASFTFGILDTTQVDALHAVGSLVVGTANTPQEVLAWQAVGADAVVVQGVGAGGHQGGWLDCPTRLPTSALLQLAKQITTLPLIGAGGVGTSAQVRELLDLGADMVAVGTLFLTTKQSVVSHVWQQHLLNQTGDDTRLTRLFSGRLARGLVGGYMERFAHFEASVPSYPTMNAMTKPLRAYGTKTANADLMSLWAGVGVGHCRQESIDELVARLTDF